MTATGREDKHSHIHSIVGREEGFDSAGYRDACKVAAVVVAWGGELVVVVVYCNSDHTAIVDVVVGTAEGQHKAEKTAQERCNHAHQAAEKSKGMTEGCRRQ